MDVKNEYLKALRKSETELKNGGLVGAIMLNAYQEKFDFEYKAIEKEIDANWQNKVSLCTLSGVIADKKIKKKMKNKASDLSNDGYSSVKEASAFAEPQLWFNEKPKKQRKAIESKIKSIKNMKKSKIVGLCRGIGLNSSKLDDSVHELIFNFLDQVSKSINNEKVLVAAAHGIGLAGASTNKATQALSILKHLIKYNLKRVRQNVALSLGFLIPFLYSIDEIIESILLLIELPSYQETYTRNLAIINALLTIKNESDSKKFVEALSKRIPDNKEVTQILTIFSEFYKGNSLDSAGFLSKLGLESDYNQIKLAALYATYVAESAKHELKNRKESLAQLAKIPIELLRHSSGIIRLAALYRLLSFSLSLKTDKFKDNFKKEINDTRSNIRTFASLALIYITGLSNPNAIEDIFQELNDTKDPLVRKGALIGMAMANNPKIMDMESADEKLLGLLELTGQNPELGFVLTIVGFY
ncbi:MAG: hypothetical protein ACXAC7_15000 [Candidatus Hodarchaeales archaeon]|jgi:hypothetical protein